MKKILTVIGARPQFIKASAVSRAIKQSHVLSEVIVHTGQHFDHNMSEIFFSDFGIDYPDYNLNVHGGTHGEMTGRMLIEIEKVIIDEKPEAVLVYGDTNSTLAGTLAAVKLHVPVAHVEAGLRSFNLMMPEEVNRVLTDHVSQWLFTPTTLAERNLIREGIQTQRIIPVGDVMYDVALHYASHDGGLLKRLSLQSKKYILVTIHRAENTDNPMRLSTIVDALVLTASDLPVIWPIHPRTREALNRLGHLSVLAKKVELIEPVGYRDMVQLEKSAAVIATDSGGVQKEAFFHKIPCVTIRDETEWIELVDAGWNRLISPVNPEAIHAVIIQSIGSFGVDIYPYGRGDAGRKIIAHFEKTMS